MAGLLLKKAIAGAAAGGAQAVDTGMKAYLLQEQARLTAERDARQNEWMSGEKAQDRAVTREGQAETARSNVAREGLESERIAAQMWLGGLQDDRAREQIKNDQDRTKAYTALAGVQARLERLKADAQEQITAMQKEYTNPKTTPQRRDELADALLTLAGKTQYRPVVGKDDLGNPQVLGMADLRRGKMVGSGAPQQPQPGKSGRNWIPWLDGTPDLTQPAQGRLPGDRIVHSAGAEERKPMVSGIRRYGPATPWSLVAEGMRKGDPLAFEYARQRVKSGPGFIGSTNVPQEIIDLLNQQPTP